MDRLDFSYKDLTGADLSCRTLSYADFTGANLTRANLRNAVLNVATLDTAVMTGADLHGASVTPDVLCCPGIIDANFEGTFCRGLTIPPKTPMLDQTGAIASYLKTLLSYDSGKIHGADIKYKVNKAGANILVWNKTSFYADRLAWTLYHGRPPASELEHMNGKPADDRIENLAETGKVKYNSSHLSRKESHPNVLTDKIYLMLSSGLIKLGTYTTHEWALKALECAKRNLFEEDLIGE